ncbi:unnamed protein product [Mytilus edulis]|uniref:Uncharacterized protein n=1 Tax=Mytilus edulis TaxID=6550 RepID=A0A8S3SYZ6_MYTED|nr:unnamed protein product [Mytilus edulis]
MSSVYKTSTTEAIFPRKMASGRGKRAERGSMDSHDEIASECRKLTEHREIDSHEVDFLMTDMDIREEKTDSPHEQLIPKVVNIAQKSTDNEDIHRVRLLTYNAAF